VLNGHAKARYGRWPFRPGRPQTLVRAGQMGTVVVVGNPGGTVSGGRTSSRGARNRLPPRRPIHPPGGAAVDQAGPGAGRGKSCVALARGPLQGSSLDVVQGNPTGGLVRRFPRETAGRMASGLPGWPAERVTLWAAGLLTHGARAPLHEYHAGSIPTSRFHPIGGGPTGPGEPSQVQKLCDCCFMEVLRSP